MPSSDALCQLVHIGMKLKISRVGITKYVMTNCVERHRRSYMSACVPSTLLNEMKKIIQ